MEEKKAKAKPAKVTEIARNQTPTPATSGERNNMEQIRELMFGSVARDFERRLKELSERLENESSQMREDYQKRIAALEARLDPQLERLQTQLRQESAARTGAIEDVDTRLTQALRTQSNEFNTVLQRHEDEAGASESRLREAIAGLEKQVMQALQSAKESLSSTSNQLGEEKVAREDLADLMAELALRLRGTQDDAGND